MSLFDKMTIGFGSGFGTGRSELFNLKPSDGAGDFTHTRNDPAAPELITNGDFATDTVWIKGAGWTIAAGVATSTGVVGSITQTGLSITAGDSYFVYITTSGGTYSFGGLKLRLGGSTDLAAITKDGTFRFKLTAESENTTFGLFVNSINGFNGNVDDISITATNFGYAATQINELGLIEGVPQNIPRSNFPLGGSVNGCPSLLLEPSKTNLLTRSEEFDNSPWTKSGTITIDSNFSISPDGRLTADKITRSSGGHFLRQLFTALPNTTYTFSFFAKDIDLDDIGFSVFDMTNTVNIVPPTSYFSQINKSTYTRIEITFTTGPTTVSVAVYVARDTGSSGSLLLWGADNEIGNITSYIPTKTSTLTRIADATNNAGTSSDFNSVEGVLYCEISALFDDLTVREISISDGTTNNTVSIRYSAVSNKIQCELVLATVSQVTLEFVVTDITSFHKVAFKYKDSDFALFIDGVEVATSISGSTFTANTLTELSFDDGAVASVFLGKCRELIAFNLLLDNELIFLTT